MLQKGVKIENQYHFGNFWMLIMITFWHYFLFHTKSILNHLPPAEYFSLAFYAERVEIAKYNFGLQKGDKIKIKMTSEFFGRDYIKV